MAFAISWQMPLSLCCFLIGKERTESWNTSKVVVDPGGWEQGDTGAQRKK